MERSNFYGQRSELTSLPSKDRTNSLDANKCLSSNHIYDATSDQHFINDSKLSALELSKCQNDSRKLPRGDLPSHSSSQNRYREKSENKFGVRHTKYSKSIHERTRNHEQNRVDYVTNSKFSRRSNELNRKFLLKRNSKHRRYERHHRISTNRENGKCFRRTFENRTRRKKRQRSRSSNFLRRHLSSSAESKESLYSSRERSYSFSSGDSKRDDSIGMYLGRYGDSIDGRYRVLRTLGKGTFGRVVECSEYGRKGLKAIKVVRSIKKYVDEARVEASILEDVQDRISNAHKGSENDSRIVHLYEDFSWNSHYCLVLEPLGISLYDFCRKTNYRPWKHSAVAVVTADVLSALACLHEISCVHTDVKLENVLFENPSDFDSSLIRSWSFRVKIIDFGGAVFLKHGQPGTGIINTRQYRSPEVLLNRGWGTSSDVWSLGCLVAELFAGELLFQTHSDLHHIALISATVGSFPVEIASSYKKLFYSTGHARWPPNFGSKEFSTENIKSVYRQLTLDKLVQQWYDLHGSHTERDILEKDNLLRFLQGCLQVDPKERLTSADALKSAFLTMKFN